MFSIAKISAAFLAAATLAHAELFITSYSVQGNGSTTVTWTSTDLDSDPALVTVELSNPSFRSQFALANNVPTTQGSLTIPTPGLIPGPGYALQLIAINNVSDIFAETPVFTIVSNEVVAQTSIRDGAPSTSAASSSSTSSTRSSSSSGSASSTGSSSSGFVSSTAAPSGSSAAASSTSSSSTAPIPSTNPASAASSLLVPTGSLAVVFVSLSTLFL